MFENAFLKRGECYEQLNDLNNSYNDYQMALEIGKKNKINVFD